METSVILCVFFVSFLGCGKKLLERMMEEPLKGDETKVCSESLAIFASFGRCGPFSPGANGVPWLFIFSKTPLFEIKVEAGYRWMP